MIREIAGRRKRGREAGARGNGPRVPHAAVGRRGVRHVVAVGPGHAATDRDRDRVGRVGAVRQARGAAGDRNGRARRRGRGRRRRCGGGGRRRRRARRRSQPTAATRARPTSAISQAHVHAHLRRDARGNRKIAAVAAHRGFGPGSWDRAFRRRPSPSCAVIGFALRKRSPVPPRARSTSAPAELAQHRLEHRQHRARHAGTDDRVPTTARTWRDMAGRGPPRRERPLSIE